MSSNAKGATAELAIAQEASRLGLGVFWPLVEHGRADLGIEVGDRILRVQCKWGRVRGDVIVVEIASSRHTPLNGYVRRKYTAAEVDAIAVYAGDLHRCFLIPIAQAQGRSAFHLRLAPARNGQRAAINFAADYEFSGAVVQLARTSHWQCGGRRFESDQLHPETSVVGTGRFSAHAASFIQRAKAGERFLITRRGKPMAALGPLDRLDLIGPDNGDLAQPSLPDEPPPADAA